MAKAVDEKVSLRTALVFWCFFVGIPCLTCRAADTGPSLSDTLAWIDGTYNDHRALGAEGHTFIERYDDDGKLSLQQSEIFKSDQCDVTLELTYDFKTDYPIFSGKHLYKINLRDIDTKSIKLTNIYRIGSFEDKRNECSYNKMTHCDVIKISFNTLNKIPLIKWSIFELNGEARGVEDKRSDAEFILDDIEYGKRLAKAFEHAVELCGGKASPF